MCTACKNHFFFDHLSQHRTDIEQEFIQLQNDHDQIRQQINDFKIDPKKTFSHQTNRSTKFNNKHNDVEVNKLIIQSNFFPISNRNEIILLNKSTIFTKKIHLNVLKQTLGKLEQQLNQPTTNIIIVG